MEISYRLSSPDGDIVLTAADLRQPFLLASGISHQTLALGGYFQALENFIFSDGPAAIAALLGELAKTELQGVDLLKAVFRSEKHGELYHIASVELFWARGSWKFAISSALSPQGMVCLKQDFNLIKELSRRFGAAPFVPLQYMVKTLPLAEGVAVMTLSEWFEGFYEWHLADEAESESRALCLWDYAAGHLFLGPDESARIIAKATEILVYYFDPATGGQIYPWHHAAGDFIVKRAQGEIEVRLVTVRDYKSLVEIPAGQPVSVLGQWLSFFLHLTIRMRLDKIDGVAETVWLDDFVVGAVIKGFLNGYQEKALGAQGLPAPRFLHLLQSFSPAELMAMSQVLLEVYAAESSADWLVIEAGLEDHWRTVCETLRLIAVERQP